MIDHDTSEAPKLLLDRLVEQLDFRETVEMKRLRVEYVEAVAAGDAVAAKGLMDSFLEAGQMAIDEMDDQDRNRQLVSLAVLNSAIFHDAARIEDMFETLNRAAEFALSIGSEDLTAQIDAAIDELRIETNTTVNNSQTSL